MDDGEYLANYLKALTKFGVVEEEVTDVWTKSRYLNYMQDQQYLLRINIYIYIYIYIK